MVAVQPAKADTVAVPVAPELPRDIIDEILDHLSTCRKSDFRLSLLSCSLISRSWVTPCRQHLFRTVFLTRKHVAKWIEAFPIPERTPAHHVRELRFWSPRQRFDVPKKFFDHIRWFTNVTLVSWKGEADLKLFRRMLSLGSLSSSVTSLTIETSTVSVLQIRDVIAQLPNLENLKLSGTVAKVRLRGMGSALRGKFNGRLILSGEHIDLGIVNMLLEVPTGLHFTELYIHGTKQSLYSALMLSEACGKNLTKLTYMTGDYGEFRPVAFCRRNDPLTLSPCSEGKEIFPFTFDFAKLPNLKEVGLAVHFTSSGICWIHVALSTITPVTSMYLSILRLGYYPPHSIPGYLLERLDNDYQLIKDEVARIDREFVGAMKLTLSGFPGFEVGGLCSHPPSFLKKPSALILLIWIFRMSSLLVPSTWLTWELCLSKCMANRPHRAGASPRSISLFPHQFYNPRSDLSVNKIQDVGGGGQGFLKAACFEGALSLVDGFSRGD